MTTPLPADESGYESVRIMRLQPGDVIVLKYNGDITQHEAEKTRARIEQRFPGHKAMVLGRDTEISVVRPDEDT